jgi:hypothetical protein
MLLLVVVGLVVVAPPSMTAGCCPAAIACQANLFHPHRLNSNNYVFHDYFKKMGKSDKAVWNYDPPKIVSATRNSACPAQAHQDK